MPINAYMQTNRGLVRDHNEDFILRLEPENLEEENERGWLYIVADGVGGADAGEVASEYASNQTVAHYLESANDNPGHRLVIAMQAANTDLRKLVAERNENKRMATTMVATCIKDQTAYIANVGDSRGYHWRNNTLRQVTQDQSLVAKLVEEGAITEEEAASHPHRNVILYSIGSEKTPKIDLFEVELEAGDKILLCSDGLTRHVADDEISEKLGQDDLEAANNSLVQLAIERGGQDNISSAIITYGDIINNEEIGGTTSRVAMPLTNHKRSRPNRAFLIPFTIFLSVIQSLLIILVWLWLNVN
ncbi:MAG: Stp1/IreP family PP2C-type Ser/Thr phosphatase [Candidatus Promineifilaceae bacterium]|nr:Stp1/IreP family PP2C-type Ser/Thr phosphatase [Candidatus Promineifilaceae bacterium]